MRKKSLILAVMLVSLLILSGCGCISSDTPTDETIVLASNKPTHNVDFNSDCELVEWYVDGALVREDQKEGGEQVNFNLDCDKYSLGKHTLTAKSCDSALTWEFSVTSHREDTEEGKEVTETTPVNEERGYSRYDSWDVRHKKAAEYWEEQKREQN